MLLWDVARLVVLRAEFRGVESLPIQTAPSRLREVPFTSIRWMKTWSV